MGNVFVFAAQDELTERLRPVGVRPTTHATHILYELVR
jgi:hypothetical protein